jgi:hypothetical protein
MHSTDSEQVSVRAFVKTVMILPVPYKKREGGFIE